MSVSTKKRNIRSGLLALSLAAAATLLPSAPAFAQDSGPLLDLLVRKGTITAQEAEDLRVELTSETTSAIIAAIAKGKSTLGLTFSGRLQVQYAGFDTEAGAANSAARPNVDTASHFFMRRVYIGMDAVLAKSWSASFNYDFAGNSFDRAYIEWADKVGSQNFSIDVGLRKVNFGYEETLSSGSLDAIERSGATRYFVEDNNGRRLGGGSYRLGIFFDGNKSASSGKSTGIFYGAALTNPERLTDASSLGTASTNTFAYWANVGYSGKASSASYIVGLSGGYLPGQGAAAAAPAGKRTADLSVGSIYGSLNIGDFTLKAEVLAAAIDSRASGVSDKSPWGAWIQPSYKINGNLEAVIRYSYLDSDERGVRVSDGVRSAGASATMHKLHEYYVGLNYYFVGNDVKLQLGYVGGRGARDGYKSESTNGFRTQLQVNF